MTHTLESPPVKARVALSRSPLTLPCSPPLSLPPSLSLYNHLKVNLKVANTMEQDVERMTKQSCRLSLGGPKPAAATSPSSCSQTWNFQQTKYIQVQWGRCLDLCVPTHLCTVALVSILDKQGPGKMTESGTLPDACIQAMIRGVAWVVKKALFGLAVEKEP